MALLMKITGGGKGRVHIANPAVINENGDMVAICTTRVKAAASAKGQDVTCTWCATKTHLLEPERLIVVDASTLCDLGRYVGQALREMA